MTGARGKQNGHQRSELWQAAFELIRTRGHERRDEPFKLASGQLSHDYIDGKYAVDTGERLAVVSRAVAELAAANGIEFDAVGGLTMGADPLSHGVAMVDRGDVAAKLFADREVPLVALVTYRDLGIEPIKPV